MKVTVILSYYNRPKWGTQAIKSVLDQTHEDWQLIVMDDQSRNVLLMPEDPRIEYHVTTTPEDVPRGPARMAMGINEAMKYVEGEAVCYLADDDFYHPVWLARVEAAFLKNEFVDVVWGELRYVDARGVPTGKKRMPYGWENPVMQLDHNQVAHRYPLRNGYPPVWPTDMDRLARELKTRGPDAGFFYDLWGVTKQWLPLPWAVAAHKRVHPHSMLLQKGEIGEVRE